MNIKITDLDMILNYLETTSLELHDDYSSEFTYKDQKILYKYIKQLQQENKQLKMINKEYERLGKEKGRGFKIINVQEYDIYELLSYKNNWYELKQFILKKLEILRAVDYVWYSDILDKMQEIEQGDLIEK